MFGTSTMAANIRIFGPLTIASVFLLTIIDLNIYIYTIYILYLLYINTIYIYILYIYYIYVYYMYTTCIDIAVVGSLTPTPTKVGQLREELEKLNILPEAMELNQAPLEEESPLRIGASSRRAKDTIPPFIPYFLQHPGTKKRCLISPA